MGEKSEIQFCTATWNPWQGCIKVSDGCKFCYMYRDKERYGKNPKIVHRSTERTFRMPLRLTEPNLIFTCSWSDWFIEEADQWRAEAWKIIRDTPQHFYQIFTKRTERIEQCLPDDWGLGYDNVMLVATAENQKMAEIRVPELLRARARWRGVSLEPLLEKVILDRLDFSEGRSFGWTNVLHPGTGIRGNDERGFRGKIDWLVVGGESGNDTGFYKYRLCELDWIEDLVGQAQIYKVPVFVKQMGTHLSKILKLNDRHGGDFTEFPAHLQVQQHPPVIVKKFNLK